MFLRKLHKSTGILPKASSKSGFTLIETSIVLVFFAAVVAIALIQKLDLDAYNRDKTRKTAINAFYYSLTQDFYKQNGYYPETISASNLPTVSPELWDDPSGHTFGDPASSYSYLPANCDNGRCGEFILRSTLEKEDTYTRKSTDNTGKSTDNSN